MASALRTQLEYIDAKIGVNKIDDEGCLTLTRSKWKHLSYLNVRGNEITNDGCKILSEGPWPELKNVDISKWVDM